MPQKVKIVLMIIAFVQFFADLYLINKWKKYCKRNNFESYYYKMPKYFAFLVLPIALFTINYQFSNNESSIVVKYTFLIVSIWFLSKLPALLFILIKDFFKLFKKKEEVAPAEISNLTDEKRREFIAATGWTLAGLPFLLTTNGGLNTTRDIKTNFIELPMLNLNPLLDGKSIAQISDLHLGSFFDNKVLSATISKLNLINPDVIVITGDFVNHSEKEYEEYYKTMQRFKQLKNVYGCLGNHDHYMPDSSHNKLIDMINSSGIKLLNNDSKILEFGPGNYLNLAGIDNTGHSQFFGDFDLALQNCDSNLKTIMLAHDPRNWDKEIYKLPIDLTLSGHTHGGQMAFEFMGEKFSPVSLLYKQWAGLYTKRDQIIYVNTGLGTVGPPIRIGLAPEITIFTLRRLENFT